MSAAEHAELLGRLSELDHRLKRSRASANDHEELQAYRDGIDELHRWGREVRSSESWRLGNGIVGAVRAPVLAIGAVLAPVLRSWRSRPANRDRAYRQAVADGSHLLPLDVGSQPHAPDGRTGPIASLVHELRRARADGPRLLDQNELEALRRAVTCSRFEPELADRARRLLAVFEPIDPVGARGRESGTLVIDVRPLQLPLECGTKTHGEHVVRALCSALPPGTRVLMLTSVTLPDVAPSVAALFDGRFIRGAVPLEDVAAFLQLMVFGRSDERDDVELLRAPWVRRAAVWLDAILGLYPSVFLRTGVDLLDYQLGIERLGRAAHVVALSETSRAELPPNLDPAIRVSVSGSRPGLVAVDGHAATIKLPERRYCVLVGNSLPHKNLITGVAAFVRSRRARRERMPLLVVALLDDDARGRLRDFVASMGGESTRLVFLQQLERSDLARVVQRAEVVIVPSLHEGFSLPVVEALGLDTPVVVSDVAAHRELLGSDPTLVDPHDPRAMAQALDDVLAQRGEVLDRQKRALDARYDETRLARVMAQLATGLVEPTAPHHSTSRTWGTRRVQARHRTETRSWRHPALAHSKVCNLEDFSHPELAPVIQEHFAHEAARFGRQFPTGREWRKHWEIAMAMRTFTDAGLLDGQHDFLGVGAGNEPTVFLLTRRARRVVATDLYLGSEWNETANASMFTDPGWHWPFAWRPERLEVAHMDAQALELPDESFHGIFSSSSIEHFGDRHSIGRALDEMHRVLTPGGILSLSSEYRIVGPAPGLPGVAMFDTQDIEELFVGDRSWSLIDPFDDSVSPATLDTSIDFDAAAWDQSQQVEELGGYYAHLIEFAAYPHIVLTSSSHVFTSFHVALRKHD